jgi:hypothetical protein
MVWQVISPALRRTIATLVGAIAWLAVTASAARAAASTPSVAPASPAPIDIVTFARLVSARDHIRLRQIVAADIDRDGDLDVVAATERGFLVWKNDGSGHLEQQAPRHQPSVAGGSPERSWEGDQGRREESLKDDLPSMSDLGAQAHAPPPLVRASAAPLCRVQYSDTSLGCSSPRAPPVHRNS